MEQRLSAAALQDDANYREWLRKQMEQSDHVLVNKRRVITVLKVLQTCARNHQADLVLRTSIEELGYLLGSDTESL